MCNIVNDCNHGNNSRPQLGFGDKTEWLKDRGRARSLLPWIRSDEVGAASCESGRFHIELHHYFYCKCVVFPIFPGLLWGKKSPKWFICLWKGSFLICFLFNPIGPGLLLWLEINCWTMCSTTQILNISIILPTSNQITVDLYTFESNIWANVLTVPKGGRGQRAPPPPRCDLRARPSVTCEAL